MARREPRLAGPRGAVGREQRHNAEGGRHFVWYSHTSHFLYTAGATHAVCSALRGKRPTIARRNLPAVAVGLTCPTMAAARMLVQRSAGL